MNWNWDSTSWRKRNKILLGVATIWPVIYMGLFFVLIFGGFFLGIMFSEPGERNTTRLDQIQLEKKIQAGEIVELRIRSSEFEAIDRSGQSFRTDVENESTREEIIRQAQELGPNQSSRVRKIDENSSTSRLTGCCRLDS